jgi:quercetin dioxygenase-like cupin family protein
VIGWFIALGGWRVGKRSWRAIHPRLFHEENTAMHIIQISLAAFVTSLLCCVSVALSAQQPEPTVTKVTEKELTDIPGKEVLILTVNYAPGATDSPHRHNADAFVYVLEGTVVEQVKGGTPVTLTAGQTFYEGPGDIHVVGRNASSTKPAKILAVLVKNKGAPPLVPVK